MRIDSAAALLAATVEELSNRAPAIVAAAAHQLGEVHLGLHFGDGSHAALTAQHSRLRVLIPPDGTTQVEAYFDDRSLNLLFDLQRRPVDQLWAGSLDVRGERPQVLAVWRMFQLLSQRGSGLRAVQGLWRSYRDLNAGRWAAPVQPVPPPRQASMRSLPQHSGWPALDYLDRRCPEDPPSDGIVGGTVLGHGRCLWDGHNSRSWWEPERVFDADLRVTMQNCKAIVRSEIDRMLPDHEPRAELYELMRDYPHREGKGLRPTLAIASCCALGGRSIDAVRSAAAIELFHNGFLVHDDIADESLNRRGRPTLHEHRGIGLAVNTGDALNLFAVDAVLSNLPTLGLARTLALIHEIVHMCRETVEGQAIELGWIREGRVPPGDEDYFRMSTKKTGWYTCISPCRVGAICAGETDPARLERFVEAFRLIGIAFQIQDDILNLIGDEALYGKEPLGDLLEGKRTIMLIHLFRTAGADMREHATEILTRQRREKTQRDAERLLDDMRACGSLEYGAALADRLAHEGVRRFEDDLAIVPENEAKAVLRQIANYVTTRPL